jgi:asparagine synthase (glutamine-hydrolysing)
MCGIAGAAWYDGDRHLDEASLDLMTDAIAHRGPDDRGTYWRRYEDGSGVGLGHRRLSIIDVGGGHQPIANEDETVWIVFNGEIYNYVELRADLIAQGHQFRTNSDTETIIHLYEQHGTDCLAKLRGMFAFAIWDERRRRLFVARDRMGQKPLVYTQLGGRFLFASEIKALLQAPDVPRELDPAALDAYLTYSYVPHPGTMYRGIHKLPPAHYAIYERGQLKIERYWDVDYQRESTESIEVLQERLHATLDEAVRLRLRSDVPIGAFLSGGIDSTAIVGLMQRHLPNPARTFTIGFPVAEYDESAYARLAAEHLKTAHQELVVDADQVELLPRLCWLFDEPFADSSTIPTYLVSQITREHVKVALTGDGGDELFCGYPRYKTVQRVAAFDRLPRPVARALTGAWWNRLPTSGGNRSFAARLRQRVKVLRESPAERYVNWVALFDRARRQSLYSKAFGDQQAEGAAESFVETAVARSTRRAPGTQAMLADLQTYLPGDLLTKVDIASMAHGLECRSPFMDHHVVELAASIPFRYHLDRQVAKPMLVGALGNIVPRAIATRPKMGFSIPLDSWFRGRLRPLVRDMLLGSEFEGRGYFNPTVTRGLVQDHLAGTSDHSQAIWSLLCLEQWHRTYLDGAAPAPV